MAATTAPSSSAKRGGQQRRLSQILRWGGLLLVLVNFISALIYIKVRYNPLVALSATAHISAFLETPSSISSSDTNEESLQRSQLERLPRDSVDRIAFVTFSYVTNRDAHKLFDFLLPAVETWAAPTTSTTSSGNSSTHVHQQLSARPTLYVVFSHTSRKPFEQYCLHQKGGITPKQFTLCQYIQPIYVACPEGKFGESPCCKQQKGLLQLYQGATSSTAATKNHNHKHSKHNKYSNKFPLYDWYAFFDDDTYLRKEYIAKILAVLQPSSFPMVGIPYNQDAKPIGFGERSCNSDGGKIDGKNIKIKQVGNKFVYTVDKKKIDDDDKMKQFRYPWGMPVFYSRGALSMLSKGFRANSLVKQCKAFDITHDVGNAMLHWMYQLPAARLPPFTSLPDIRDDFIGSHWVGREDMRKELFSVDKRGKKGRIISKAMPKGAFSFYKTHETWILPENQPPNVLDLSTVKEEELKWYPNVTGYEQTRTFIRYGNPEAWEEGIWHTMRMRDCN